MKMHTTIHGVRSVETRRVVFKACSWTELTIESDQGTLMLMLYSAEREDGPPEIKQVQEPT